jgi:hypothetical protein
MTFIDGILRESAGNYQRKPEEIKDFIVVSFRISSSPKEEGNWPLD